MKRIIKTSLITITFVILIVFIIFPAITAAYAVKSAKAEVGSIPTNFEEVEFTTTDGMKLFGWYKKPANGNVIIVVHGAGSSKNDMRKYIEMFERNGFGVFAIDMRGHGQSNGRTNRVGWQGTKDISAAVKFLSGKNEVHSIGGFGTSLGGEVLLGAISENHEIKAVVSEGATFRSFNEFYDYQFTYPIIQNISTLKVQDLFLTLYTGENPPKTTILSSIQNSNARIFLIASGEIEKEINYSNMFAEKSENISEVWIVTDTGHVGAFDKNPQEYEEKVIQFYNNNLK